MRVTIYRVLQSRVRDLRLLILSERDDRSTNGGGGERKGLKYSLLQPFHHRPRNTFETDHCSYSRQEHPPTFGHSVRFRRILNTKIIVHTYPVLSV